MADLLFFFSFSFPLGRERVGSDGNNLVWRVWSPAFSPWVTQTFRLWWTLFSLMQRLVVPPWGQIATCRITNPTELFPILVLSLWNFWASVYSSSKFCEFYQTWKQFVGTCNPSTWHSLGLCWVFNKCSVNNDWMCSVWDVRNWGFFPPFVFPVRKLILNFEKLTVNCNDWPNHYRYSLKRGNCKLISNR